VINTSVLEGGCLGLANIAGGSIEVKNAVLEAINGKVTLELKVV